MQVLQTAGIKSARLTTKLEARGQDGRGFEGPGLGTVAQTLPHLLVTSCRALADPLLTTLLADHGVFVPFIHMFGKTAPVPIVEVSYRHLEHIDFFRRARLTAIVRRSRSRPTCLRPRSTASAPRSRPYAPRASSSSAEA